MAGRKIRSYQMPKCETQVETISQSFKTLELYALEAAFRNVAESVQKTHGTLFDFTESLLEKEFIYREENRIIRRIQQAKFPAKRTLKQFDFSFQPNIDQNLVNELASCRFVEQGKNIIFLGPPGVGKTHLSISLGIEAIQEGYTVRFLKLDELIDLVENAEALSTPRLLRAFLIPDVLILDDIDYYDTGKNAGSFLFKLLFKRHEDGKPIIFSSNRNFDQWEKLFGEHERAASIIDRITERAEIINIAGDSYRIKDKIKKYASESKVEERSPKNKKN